MIELLRYARLKPEGVVSAKATPDAGGSVVVSFKRFDVSTGKELDPEESLITFGELEARLQETKTEMAVIEELLALRPK